MFADRHFFMSNKCPRPTAGRACSRTRRLFGLGRDRHLPGPTPPHRKAKPRAFPSQRALEPGMGEQIGVAGYFPSGRFAQMPSTGMNSPVEACWRERPWPLCIPASSNRPAASSIRGELDHPITAAPRPFQDFAPAATRREFGILGRAGMAPLASTYFLYVSGSCTHPPAQSSKPWASGAAPPKVCG